MCRTMITNGTMITKTIVSSPMIASKMLRGKTTIIEFSRVQIVLASFVITISDRP